MSLPDLHGKTIRIGIPFPLEIANEIGNYSMALSPVIESCSPSGNFNFVLYDYASILGDKIASLINRLEDCGLFEEQLMELYYDSVSELFLSLDSDITTSFHKTDEYLATASVFSHSITNKPEIRELVNKLQLEKHQQHITLVLKDACVLPECILRATYEILTR